MYKSVRLVLVLKITSDRYSISYLWVHLLYYLCNSIANSLFTKFNIFHSFHLVALSYTACSWRSLRFKFPIELEKYLLTCFYLHTFGISLRFPVEHREIRSLSLSLFLSFSLNFPHSAFVSYNNRLSLIITLVVHIHLHRDYFPVITSHRRSALMKLSSSSCFTKCFVLSIY